LDSVLRIGEMYITKIEKAQYKETI
jgi:hypothetical protein